MKNIAVIQRVEFIEKRNEYCDALDKGLDRFTIIYKSVSSISTQQCILC